jgi:hypothetical protein
VRGGEIHIVPQRDVGRGLAIGSIEDLPGSSDTHPWIFVLQSFPEHGNGIARQVAQACELLQ